MYQKTVDPKLPYGENHMALSYLGMTWYQYVTDIRINDSYYVLQQFVLSHVTIWRNTVDNAKSPVAIPAFLQEREHLTVNVST